MIKTIIMCAAMLLATSVVPAQERISLKALANGEFSAKTVSGITPIRGTDQYARISADGKQIV